MKISPEALRDYLALCRMDPRGSRTDRAILEPELTTELARLESERTPRPRGDGMLLYRGRKSRRYQYIVDPRTDTLVQVRRESEVREQGSNSSRPRRT